MHVAENLERVGASQYCSICGIMSLISDGDSSAHSELYDAADCSNGK